MTDFARNLRHLCRQEQSVSELCRRIDVNRQQFARYLGGSNRPSAHNLWRICQYFDVSEDLLAQPHDQFVQEVSGSRGRVARRAEMLTAAFPGDVRRLRNFAGVFHAHFRSPSHPESVVRALSQIFESDGLFHSRTIERIRHPKTGQVTRARYLGLVSLHDDTLFLVERGRITLGGISETVLTPVYRSAHTWLTGLVLGFSWRNRKAYASQCIWKRLRPSTGPREALSRCGAFSLDSRELDPIVVDHFASSGAGDSTNPMVPTGW